jgi:hypothetical protein
MSESGDYKPAAHWGGHTFASGKKHYRNVVDRSYDEAVAKNIDPKGLFPKTLKTKSEAPLVIGFDVTASMDDWPITICSKLPYLEFEGQEYLGDGMEISWCAFGDSKYDKYPFQARKFVKGNKLKKELDKLIHEKGGGGNGKESYDLAARYYSQNCDMPEAIRKPIFIFICDEGIYDSPNAEDWSHTEKSDWEAAFAALCEKFSVYCIRKRYHGSESSIHKQWVNTLGEDRVVMLEDAGRVVDVIFGLLAKETGRIDYFEDELKDRQGKDEDGDEKIDVVMKSLHSVHKLPKASLKKLAGPKGGGKSKSVSLKGKSKSKKAKSISLLDDE